MPVGIVVVDISAGFPRFPLWERTAAPLAFLIDAVTEPRPDVNGRLIAAYGIAC
jgi:hypothetical protein